MTTRLTETGWENVETGELLGTWTNEADLVDEGDEIIVDSDVTANTLAGADTISGGGGGLGILNQGTIETGFGNDSISGDGNRAGGITNQGTIETGFDNDTISGGGRNSGIDNSGTIETGFGNDSISGGGGNGGIFNSGTIETGFGNDTISGFAGNPTLAPNGITNSGTIKTENGNDTITGFAVGAGSGIGNLGTIETGNGNDTISGVGELSGNGIGNSGTIKTGNGNDIISGDGVSLDIVNSGTIETGNDQDTVDALTGGFSGDGMIDLGQGKDLIQGFGQQTVDGGREFDTAQFDFSSDEVDISIISDNSLVLTKSSEEMTFTNVELFEFSDVSFSFSKIDFDEGNLPAGTVITDQFEGLTISTPQEFGVMIFDTNNPTGGDDDLGAGIGNALIISEDGDSSDPDDNAAGGTISIEFDELVAVTGIGLLDIDEEGGTIDFFDDDSKLIEVLEIPAFEDGNIQRLNPNVQGVARMDINLAGSAALTELNLFGPLNDSMIIDTDNELV